MAVKLFCIALSLFLCMLVCTVPCNFCSPLDDRGTLRDHRGEPTVNICNAPLFLSTLADFDSALSSLPTLILSVPRHPEKPKPQAWMSNRTRLSNSRGQLWEKVPKEAGERLCGGEGKVQNGYPHEYFFPIGARSMLCWLTEQWCTCTVKGWKEHDPFTEIWFLTWLFTISRSIRLD
ncbi:hypothetical protein MLD38_039736 [Melastoma candidum]|uniref:Uncharacterized protein n=1 Tax=Melastoma candidum TaxID=119954 RepID=A0ACB9L3G1_9MYRT|nr:hypothetical protein MLD38_039736 [Melastoma candidum]